MDEWVDTLFDYPDYCPDCPDSAILFKSMLLMAEQLLVHVKIGDILNANHAWDSLKSSLYAWYLFGYRKIEIELTRSSIAL